MNQNLGVGLKVKEIPAASHLGKLLAHQLNHAAKDVPTPDKCQQARWGSLGRPFQLECLLSPPGMFTIYRHFWCVVSNVLKPTWKSWTKSFGKTETSPVAASPSPPSASALEVANVFGTSADASAWLKMQRIWWYSHEPVWTKDRFRQSRELWGVCPQLTTVLTTLLGFQPVSRQCHKIGINLGKSIRGNGLTMDFRWTEGVRSIGACHPPPGNCLFSSLPASTLEEQRSWSGTLDDFMLF